MAPKHSSPNGEVRWDDMLDPSGNFRFNAIESPRMNNATNSPSLVRDTRIASRRQKLTLRAQQSANAGYASESRRAFNAFRAAESDIEHGTYSIDRINGDMYDAYETDVDSSFEAPTGEDAADMSSEQIMLQGNRGVAQSVMYVGNAQLRGMSSLAFNISRRNTKNSEAMSRAIGASINQGANLITNTLFVTNGKLDTINGSIQTLINFQNQNTAKFYGQTLGMVNGLGKMLENFNKTIAPSKREERRFSPTGIKGFFKGYVDYITSGLMETVLGSLSGGLGGDKPLSTIAGGGFGGGGFSSKAGSLVGRLTKTIAKSFLPKSIIDRVDSARMDFRNLADEFMEQISDRLEASKNPLFQSLAGVFGNKRSKVNALNMGAYSKEPILWNGLAQKALTEVIPELLTQINTSINKGEVEDRYYDYNSGKFMTRSQIQKRYDDEYRDRINASMNPAIQKITDALEESGKTQSEQAALFKEISALFDDAFAGKDARIATRTIGTKLTDFGIDDQVAKSIVREVSTGIRNGIRQINDLNNDIQTTQSVYRNLSNVEGRPDLVESKREVHRNRDYNYREFNRDPRQVIRETQNKVGLTEFDLSRDISLQQQVLNILFTGYDTAAEQDKLEDLIKVAYDRASGSDTAAGRFLNGPRIRTVRGGVSGAIERIDAGTVSKVLDYVTERAHDLTYDLADNLTTEGIKNKINQVKAKFRRNQDDEEPLGNGPGFFNMKKALGRGPGAASTYYSEKRSPQQKNQTSDTTARVEKIAMTPMDKLSPGDIANNDNIINGAINELQKEETPKDLSSTITQAANAIRTSLGAMVGKFIGWGASIFGKDGMLGKLWNSTARKKVTGRLFTDEDAIFGAQYQMVKDWGRDIWNRTKQELGSGYDYVRDAALKYKYGENYRENEDFQNSKFWSQYTDRTWIRDRMAKAREEAARRKAEREAERQARLTDLEPVEENEPLGNGPGFFDRSVVLGYGPDEDQKSDENQKKQPRRSRREYAKKYIKEHRDALRSLKDRELIPDIITNVRRGQEEYREANKPVEGERRTLKVKISDKVAEVGHTLDLVKENTIAVTEAAIGKIEENPEEKKKRTAAEYAKDFMGTLKNRLPKALAGGLVGAGVGVLNAANSSVLGAMLGPMGPLSGAIVGAGLSILTKSEAFQNIMFGKLNDETGEREGGLISQKMQERFKAIAPSVVGGAAVGALHGVIKGALGFNSGIGVLGMQLLPGGIIGGAILGAGIGLLKNSDRFKTLLFGEEDEDGTRTGTFLSKSYNKIKGMFGGDVKQALFKGLSGAGVGALTGTVLAHAGFLPAMLSAGGPIGLGIAGLGLGIASTSKRFQEYIFGTEYVDEKGNKRRREDGLLTKVRNLINVNLVEPIGNAFKEKLLDMIDWTKDKITMPFKLAFGPIIDNFKKIGEDIRDFAKNKMESFGRALYNMTFGLLGKLFRPFTNLIGKVGKLGISALAGGAKLLLSPVSALAQGASLLTSKKRREEEKSFRKSFSDYLGTEEGKNALNEYQNIIENDGENKLNFIERAMMKRDLRKGRGEFANAFRTGYNAQMTAEDLNSLDWRSEVMKKYERRDARKERQKENKLWNEKIYRDRQSIINRDLRGNSGVTLSDEAVKTYRERFMKHGIDEDFLQTSDDIMQLLYHPDEFRARMNGTAPEKGSEQKIGDVADAVNEAEEAQRIRDERRDALLNMIVAHLGGEPAAIEHAKERLDASIAARDKKERSSLDKRIKGARLKGIDVEDPRLKAFDLRSIDNKTLRDFYATVQTGKGRFAKTDTDTLLKFLQKNHIDPIGGWTNLTGPVPEGSDEIPDVNGVSDKDARIIDMAKLYISDTKISFAEIGRQFGISGQTVSRYLREKLPNIDSNLAKQVQDKLDRRKGNVHEAETKPTITATSPAPVNMPKRSVFKRLFGKKTIQPEPEPVDEEQNKRKGNVDEVEATPTITTTSSTPAPAIIPKRSAIKRLFEKKTIQPEPVDEEPNVIARIRIGDEQIKQMAQMFVNGDTKISFAEIGRQFGISGQTVSRYLREKLPNIDEALSNQFQMKLNDRKDIRNRSFKTRLRHISEFAERFREREQGRLDIRDSFAQFGLSLPSMDKSYWDNLEERSQIRNTLTGLGLRIPSSEENPFKINFPGQELTDDEKSELNIFKEIRSLIDQILKNSEEEKLLTEEQRKIFNEIAGNTEEQANLTAAANGIDPTEGGGKRGSWLKRFFANRRKKEYTEREAGETPGKATGRLSRAVTAVKTKLFGSKDENGENKEGFFSKLFSKIGSIAGNAGPFLLNGVKKLGLIGLLGALGFTIADIVRPGTISKVGSRIQNALDYMNDDEGGIPGILQGIRKKLYSWWEGGEDDPDGGFKDKLKRIWNDGNGNGIWPTLTSWKDKVLEWLPGAAKSFADWFGNNAELIGRTVGDVAKEIAWPMAQLIWATVKGLASGIWEGVTGKSVGNLSADEAAVLEEHGIHVSENVVKTTETKEAAEEFAVKKGFTNAQVVENEDGTYDIVEYRKRGKRQGVDSKGRDTHIANAQAVSTVGRTAMMKAIFPNATKAATGLAGKAVAGVGKLASKAVGAIPGIGIVGKAAGATIKAGEGVAKGSSTLLSKITTIFGKKAASKATEEVTEVVVEESVEAVARGAAEMATRSAAGEVVEDLAESGAKTAIRSFSEWVGKIASSEALKTAIEKIVPGGADGLIGKAITSLTSLVSKAATATGKVLKKIGDIIKAGIAKLTGDSGAFLFKLIFSTTVGAVFGAVDTATLFGVDKSGVDGTMILVSSLFGAFLGIPFVGTILDIAMSISTVLGWNIKQDLATEFYKFLVKNDEDKLRKLELSRDQQDIERQIYNALNNTNLDQNAYNDLNNNLVTKGINAVKGLFGRGAQWTKSSEQALTALRNAGYSDADILEMTKDQAVLTSTLTSLGYGEGPKLNGLGYGTADFDQANSKWANKRIGTYSNGRPATMKDAGCGPTALSMVANQLGIGYGSGINPYQVANITRDTLSPDGAATARTLTAGAARLGMNSVPLRDVNAVASSLAHNRPVIMSGHDSGSGTPYTKAGHIVVADKLLPNGRVRVRNPMGGGSSNYSLNSLRTHTDTAFSMGLGYGPTDTTTDHSGSGRSIPDGSTNHSGNFGSTHHSGNFGSEFVIPQTKTTISATPSYEEVRAELERLYGSNFMSANNLNTPTNTGAKIDTSVLDELIDREYRTFKEDRSLDTSNTGDNISTVSMTPGSSPSTVDATEEEEGEGDRLINTLKKLKDALGGVFKKLTGFAASLFGFEKESKDGDTVDTSASVLSDLNTDLTGSILTGSDQERFLKAAMSQIGYLEKNNNADLNNYTANPGSNNYTKYAKEMGANPNNWCAYFVSWAAKAANIPENTLPRNGSCTEIMKQAIKMGIFHYRGEYTPRPGDLILFNWKGVANPKNTGSISCDHVGVVEYVDGKQVHTIEGNASPMSGQGNYQGVHRKYYTMTSKVIVGYVHPNWSAASITVDPTALLKLSTFIAGSSNVGTIDLNGTAGNGTESASEITLTGSSMKEQVWKYLRNIGFKPHAAAGVMGNWQDESNVNPKRIEADYVKSFPGYGMINSASDIDSYTRNFLFPLYDRDGLRYSSNGYRGTDGRYYPGIGLAQWTGPRAQKMIDYMTANNLGIWNLPSQLSFFNNELNTNYRSVIEKLNAQASPAAAAAKFLDTYEMYDGFAAKNQDRFAIPRGNNAESFYQQFKDTPLGYGDGQNSENISTDQNHDAELLKSLGIRDGMNVNVDSSQVISVLTKIADAMNTVVSNQKEAAAAASKSAESSSVTVNENHTVNNINHRQSSQQPDPYGKAIANQHALLSFRQNVVRADIG